MKEALLLQWHSNARVSFYEPESTDEVYELLHSQDVFVFPTTFEGTPVSILECLANGIVTITNDLPGGIRDMLNENTGFRCELNNVPEFINKISMLHHDRKLLRQLQEACFTVSNSKYDIKNNADNYFLNFLEYEKLKRGIKYNVLKMSRLDKAYFPNTFVKLIRNGK